MENKIEKLVTDLEMQLGKTTVAEDDLPESTAVVERKECQLAEFKENHLRMVAALKQQLDDMTTELTQWQLMCDEKIVELKRMSEECEKLRLTSVPDQDMLDEREREAEVKKKNWSLCNWKGLGWNRTDRSLPLNAKRQSGA